MKDFIDSGDEYEQAVKNQKRQKSKNRGKTEEKNTSYKSKIYINCIDKNQLTPKNLKIVVNNSPNKIIENNNIESDILNISFSTPLYQSSKAVSPPALDKNESGKIDNEVDNNNDNNNLENKLTLFLNKKSYSNKYEIADNKLFSVNENIRKHKESKSSKFSNFNANFSKEMILNKLNRNSNLNNCIDQKVLISSRDFNKKILKTSENISNNSIKLNNKHRNTDSYLHHTRKVNNSEEINLNKLNENKQNNNASNEEKNEEEEKKNYEDVKKEFNYSSSSCSEEETKKEKDKKSSKIKFSSKEINHKSINRKNKKNLTQSYDKNKKLPINENKVKTSLFKKNNNENNEINKRSASNTKNYKKSVDMKILQKNNININDYFKPRYNIYISSAYSLAKKIDGEQCQNEDSYLIKENIFSQNFNVYGIFDGHGKDSHKISKNISENMGKFFTSQKIYKTFLDKLIKKSYENELKNSDNKIEKNDEDDEIPLNMHTIKKLFDEDNFYFIKRSVKYCENKLKDKEFNLKFTGSTCVMLFLLNDRLICSNIGDSRCVLFKCSQNDKWSYINLSTEHKPTNEEEKKRIKKSGGDVHPFIDEDGNYEDDIQRVWVKDKQYPGLALSRSIGDLAGKKIGIISVPTFITKKIDNRSKFIILGSDGFWDVMGMSEIINTVKPYLNTGNSEIAAKILVEKAQKAWSKINGIDDITVIIIFISADLATKYETNMNVRVSGEDN